MELILESPRLLLRQFTLADADSLLQLNSNPAVMQYLHEAPLHTIADAEKVLTDIIFPQYKNKLGRWAVILKENNQFLGWCGLKYLAENDEVDLGYRLLQEHWGHGYATEGALHCVEYGFKKLSLPFIIGRAHVDNKASIKVLEKVGMEFVREGVEDECPVKIYRIQA